MKLAVVSDTHLGDPDCTLIQSSEGAFVKGEKYDHFLRAAGKDNDYLILLGDILDFSVTSYHNAYKAAKLFFSMLQQDGVAKEMIYIPGNHDYDIWTNVEHEVNIINRIRKGELPRKFKMSVPGIIDDRNGAGRFFLPGVDRHETGFNYGGLFLDSLTLNSEIQQQQWASITNSDKASGPAPGINGTPKLSGEKLNFNFAYPNLYLLVSDGCIMLTHGHYLEQYWSSVVDWAPRIFGPDIFAGEIDLKQWVGVNFPLNQLACSGVGQADLLTGLLFGIQDEVRSGSVNLLRKYLDNLDNYLDEKVLEFHWTEFYNELITDGLSNRIKQKILESLSNSKSARFNDKFLRDPEVKNRFARYYEASCREIAELNNIYGIGIKEPDAVIFGHTHQPVGYHQGLKAEFNGKKVTLYNSGSWLSEISGGAKKFCGAEVFVYNTSRGLQSVSVM